MKLREGEEMVPLYVGGEEQSADRLSMYIVQKRELMRRKAKNCAGMYVLA